jgi:hypothetical protein
MKRWMNERYVQTEREICNPPRPTRYCLFGEWGLTGSGGICLVTMDVSVRLLPLLRSVRKLIAVIICTIYFNTQKVHILTTQCTSKCLVINSCYFRKHH